MFSKWERRGEREEKVKLLSKELISHIISLLKMIL